jgi:ABC-type multidrug transport system fused ATPase/permease subunit
MNAENKKKWAIIKSFVRDHKLAFMFTIINGMIANILVVLIPVSLGKYFDFLFGFQSHRAAFLDLMPFSFWSTIQQYSLFLFVLILLKMIFQYFQRFQMAYLGEKFIKELREQLFQQQLRIQAVIYDDFGTGRYLLRHSGDLKSIQNYLTRGIIRFSTDIFLLLVAFGFLLWLSKIIFLIIVGGFVLTILCIYFLNKILFKISVNQRNTRSGLLSFVNRQLQATKTIKAFNKDVTEVGKYNKRSSRLFDVGIRFQKIYNLIYVSVPAFLYIILVIVLYYIYELKQQGSILFETSEMLGFVLLFITILPIFRRVLRVTTVWELGNISFNKLLKVFDLPIEPNTSDLQPYLFEEGNIKFIDVDFSYSDEQTVFKNLNFIIKPNCINQIKIGNGEGKSTLVKLFAGLYLPDNGKILYDGQAMEILDLKSLRKKTTFISDEFSLIGRTVFEVVSYSRNKAKIPKAQKILDEFQQNVPLKMQLNLSDKVMEGGKNLSKSQIKMLQYIRAVLSEKPIIIIDEPIRNLEKNTRKNILDWLGLQAVSKTIIFLCSRWKDPSIIINNTIDIAQFQSK